MALVATMVAVALGVGAQSATASPAPSSSGSGNAIDQGQLGFVPVPAADARKAGIAVADPEVFYLKDGRDFRCLDADRDTANGNGTKVQLWDCQYGAKLQMWRVKVHWTGAGQQYRVISNIETGRCLDGDTSYIGNGGKVQLWDCQPGADAQAWWTLPNTSNLYNHHSGKCLDADAATSGQNGTKIHVWNCEAGTPVGQTWFYSFANYQLPS
ncbi:RICIN domain-containing protein [Micromonospora pisi]|uniref:RICIN domain-containing protein n=1 Tax=Micromonospora pisi TaxID=589240 RepID=UPI00147696A5|nr:RICIN domain-containing protein [Micromonospora pisi]